MNGPKKRTIILSDSQIKFILSELYSTKEVTEDALKTERYHKFHGRREDYAKLRTLKPLIEKFELLLKSD